VVYVILPTPPSQKDMHDVGLLVYLFCRQWSVPHVLNINKDFTVLLLILRDHLLMNEEVHIHPRGVHLDPTVFHKLHFGLKMPC